MTRKRGFVYSGILLIVSVVVFFQPSHISAGGLLWSSPTLVDRYNGIDILPNAIQASNGTLWLAWQSGRFGGTVGRYDILYKTLTGSNWSPTGNFTSSGMNAGPSIAQLSNGTIFLFWSANPTGNSCSSQCNLDYERFKTQPQTWSSATRLSLGTFNDSASSEAVGRDGTLWLVWTRVVTNCSVNPCSVTQQLYYRTLKGNLWSTEVQITSDANWNYDSSVAIGKDGVVRVAWSKSPPSTSGGQIYYKTFNGSAWSSEVQIVTSSTTDDHPSLIQDRNGTLWVFWARQVYYTSLDFHYVMLNKFSLDNGNTWSSEAPMTNTSNSVDSKMPRALQASNPTSKSLWVFYSSDLLYNDFDIYALMSSSVSPVHDVTISSITASPGQRFSWTITVKVADLGDYSETVSVTLTLSNTTTYNLGPQSGSVAIGGSTNIIFTWNSAGAPVGVYSATASVSPVTVETLGNYGDNNLRVSNLIQIVSPPVTSGGSGGGHPVPF